MSPVFSTRSSDTKETRRIVPLVGDAESGGSTFDCAGCWRVKAKSVRFLDKICGCEQCRLATCGGFGPLAIGSILNVVHSKLNLL
jgi:hypothetical protein